jgi:putative transposase
MATDTAAVDAIFVHELRIIATPSQLRTLGARFEAARLVYNAMLGEDLRRSQLVRESREYRHAREIAETKLRRSALRMVDARFGFTRYGLYGWASQTITNSWLAEHLDAQCVRSLAARAHTAVYQYTLGRNGRPRFKRRGQLSSLEGQSAKQGIRYSNGKLVWRDLSLDLAIDASDPHTLHVLACPIRRVRIVRRRIKGRDRYFAALVLTGKPYLKLRTSLGDRRIGVDPGPGVFGVAIGDWGALIDLREAQDSQSNRRLERSIDRKLRRANPSNYASNGDHLPGRRRWLKSNRLGREYDRLREARRIAAARRKSARGYLVNALLRLGSEVRVEANSFSFFRRVFGRSSNNAAPGLFVALLKRRCSELMIPFWSVPTSLRLSRTCHGCGRVVAKGLGDRVHVCPCGVTAQRDVYAAWLATFANIDPSGSSWVLDIDRARMAWSGAGTRLPAMSSPLSVREFVSIAVEQAASGRTLSAGLEPKGSGTERLAGEVAGNADDARDDVGSAEGPREFAETPSRYEGDFVAVPVHGNDENAMPCGLSGRARSGSWARDA